jgi:UDP-glucose 4-epimerase
MSGVRPTGSVAVLLYHSIATVTTRSFARLTVGSTLFDEHLAALRKHHVEVIPFSEVPAALASGRRAVAITIDDGLADAADAATPALLRRGLPATLFVPSAFVGASANWLPGEDGSRPMLSWTALDELVRAGFEIGSHGKRHIAADVNSPEIVRRDAAESRTNLEQKLGCAVSSFAYPFGYHAARARRAVRAAGFAQACVVGDLPARAGDDRWSPPRLQVGPETKPAELLMMARRQPSAAARSWAHGKQRIWHAGRVWAGRGPSEARRISRNSLLFHRFAGGLMRVLVSGGAGFIGSHLCDALVAKGDEVHVVDDLSTGRPGRLPDGVVLHKETILNVDRLIGLVARVRPGLIYHLAAQIDVRSSVAFPAADAEVNVVGTVNVLEAARAVGARVVFSSSGGALYGRGAPVPSMESVAPEPESPYGISKYSAEQYIGLYNRLYGAAHAILRFANVYGPRQSPSGEAGVVTVFCERAIKANPLTIYGDGTQTRDYVYVSDCIAAFIAAGEHGKAGTWNIGTGVEVSVLQLAAIVSRITGDRTRQQFAPPRAGELPRSALVFERAERDLGWRPSVLLARGVAAVVSWLAAGAPDRVLPTDTTPQ